MALRLQPAHAEAVVKAPARLGVTAAILFVAGGFLITHGSVTPSRSVPKAAVRLTATDASVTPPRTSSAGDDAVVDLYGNEVNDAIATYTLDPAGSLYELHSPQTELPRLASPKS
jgi:hypothetical protein